MTKNDYDENEIQEVNEIEEEQNEEPIAVEKKKTPTKKDRSPAQQLAFKKCLEARTKRAEEQLALKEKKDKILLRMNAFATRSQCRYTRINSSQMTK